MIELAQFWTPGVKDTVIGGLILATVLAIWAWLKTWRMRNPLAWVVGSMKEDAALNVGGFISGGLVFTALGFLLGSVSPLTEDNLYLTIGCGSLFSALFIWLTYFVDRTEPNSTKPLFYKCSSERREQAEVDAPPPTLTAPKVKSNIDLKRFSDRNSVEFRVMKILYQTRGQSEGITLVRFCVMGAMKTFEAGNALINLGAAQLVEEVVDDGVSRYRLTPKGEDHYLMWTRPRM